MTVAMKGFTGIDNQEIPGITGGALDSDEGAPGEIYFQSDHHGGIRCRNITISVPAQSGTPPMPVECKRKTVALPAGEECYDNPDARRSIDQGTGQCGISLFVNRRMR
jgi:hypothetical protein